MRNSLLSLLWFATCVFFLTLRAGALSTLDDYDLTAGDDAEHHAEPKVSSDPPHIKPRQVSPRVSEALKTLRPLQQGYGSSSIEKRNGMLGNTLYYTKQIIYFLFMNNVPISSSTPRKLSKPLQYSIDLLRSAAAEQDPDAIFLLAEMNFFGNYTYPRNYTEALIRYHDLATLNGNSSAQHMLGLIYATGLGGAVERDQAKASTYHTFAAKGGNTRSEMTLAYRYYSGIATPRNCNKAAHWYKKVADKAIAFARTGPPGGVALQREAYRIADEDGGVYGEGASVVSSGINANRAGPNSDANAAYEDVLEYLDLMSRKGDLMATFSLGRLHYEGKRSMKRSLRTARAYFMTVARKYWQKDGSVREEDQGIAKIASKAAGYIGRMFLRGEGMEQSYEKALTWFRRGVKNGDALCQYELGIMYLNGLGVRMDPLLASDYFRAAAEQDFASAEVNMGKLFLDQGNVPEATRYFDLAARHGHIEAFYHLAEINNNGIGRDRSCNMATAYYKLVAEKAEAIHSAFDEANQAYDEGDIDAALPIYMMAAEQGYESAQANVAYLLDSEKSVLSLSSFIPWKSQQMTTVAKNSLLALIYWTRSAKQSNIDSMVKMGDYYLLGLGVPGDNEKAATCYQTAAEAHHSAQALWNLGWIHENGIGVEQDFHLAKRFYDQSLETNSEAYLPVKLALIKLKFRSWWNGVTGGKVRGVGKDEDPKPQEPPETWSDFFNSFFADPHPYYHDGDYDPSDEAAHPLDEYLTDEGIARYGGGAGGRGDNDFDDEYYDDAFLESTLILVLMGALAWLMWYRNQRVLGHRRELERTGNYPADGAAVPAQGQVQGAQQQHQGQYTVPADSGDWTDRAPGADQRDEQLNDTGGHRPTAPPDGGNAAFAGWPPPATEASAGGGGGS